MQVCIRAVYLYVCICIYDLYGLHDETTLEECVICLSDPKDPALLPWRCVFMLFMCAGVHADVHSCCSCVYACAWSERKRSSWDANETALLPCRCVYMLFMCVYVCHFGVRMYYFIFPCKNVCVHLHVNIHRYACIQMCVCVCSP